MRIAVFGAGTIGCYVGGKLAAAGADVVLIGRPRMQKALAGGLSLTNYQGGETQVDPLPFATGAEAARDASVVLVCVKSKDSARAGAALRPYVGPSTTVISFQNGIGNADVLAKSMDHDVIPGMVAFNVAWQGDGHFHQGTGGELHILKAPRLNEAIFARARMPLSVHDEMGPVMWAKLMLNLNNAINALSGLPLREQLNTRDFRRCLALAQTEFLGLCDAAQQPLARLSPLPAAFLPRILRLPDAAFRMVARSMLAIDPLARSSMADDLALGRPPELDAINGEVTRLADRLGRAAAVNSKLTALVTEAATASRRTPWKAADLLEELRAA